MVRKIIPPQAAQFSPDRTDNPIQADPSTPNTDDAETTFEDNADEGDDVMQDMEQEQGHEGNGNRHSFRQPPGCVGMAAEDPIEISSASDCSGSNNKTRPEDKDDRSTLR